MSPTPLVPHFPLQWEALPCDRVHSLSDAPLPAPVLEMTTGLLSQMIMCGFQLARELSRYSVALVSGR